MENSAYSGKYDFFRFLTCDQKNVKSHVFFWIFKKTKKKRFPELCVILRSTQKEEQQQQLNYI